MIENTEKYEIKTLGDLMEGYEERLIKESKLRFYETENELDIEHMKHCLENNVLVSLVTYGGQEFYEFYMTEPDNIYDFEKSRCLSENHLIKWIYHMSEKNWITRQHIKQFIDIFYAKQTRHDNK